jgi:hypothetical protein
VADTDSILTSAQGKIFSALVRAVSRRPVLDHETGAQRQLFRSDRSHSCLCVMASIPYIAPEGWKTLTPPRVLTNISANRHGILETEFSYSATCAEFQQTLRPPWSRNPDLIAADQGKHLA